MSKGFHIENKVLKKYTGTDPIITIPREIEKIEEFAFRDNKTVREVAMPDSVVSIGTGAFSGCEKLKTVKFSETLGVIDSGAFEGCKALTEITLPNTVDFVGAFAFRNCHSLKAFSAPEKTRFATHVFVGCKNLIDPSGFVVINHTAMGYYGNAQIVTVPEGVYTLNDRLFETFYMAPFDYRKIKEIKLPSSLRKIGAQAFFNCTSLSSVEIPDGLTHIGLYAFSGCKALVSLRLPDSITTIQSNAFASCESLKQINLPASLTHLGHSVFHGCKALADEKGYVRINKILFNYYGAERNISLPEGIEFIADLAFKNTGIISIQLPSTLKILGSAFENCDMLEEIVVPEGVEEIAHGTFAGCARLSQISLPSTITKIGKSAFSDCIFLKEIELPRGIQTIEEYAFFSCKSLEKISLPSGISVLEKSTFDGCSRLKSVKLPDKLKKIDSSAFSGCAALEHVDLPSGVEEIQDLAFQDCTALKRIGIASTTEASIDFTAFENCIGLTDENGFVIVGNVLYYYNGEGGDLTIPEGIIAIAPNAFREGYSLEAPGLSTKFGKEGSLRSVSLPKSLKTIGEYAFAECKLREITFHENLESIGEGAFEGCHRIGRIALPDSVTHIGKGAFSDCKSMVSFTFGNGLTQISPCLFQYCLALKSIHLPKNITKIGEDAFTECKKLQKITVNTENPIFSAMDGILFSKDTTELILFPGGKRQTEYRIPDFVTSIASRAFYDCMNLKKIVIPETVFLIGDEVFPRVDWMPGSTHNLTDIQVSPKAGRKGVGQWVFDFPYSDTPLLYPKLPVNFVRETSVRIRLGMGFCQHPEKFEGEYATLYKKYVTSHERTILKKAKKLRFSDVEAYFSEAGDEKNKANAVFKPNLSKKKLSEVEKVELLEETVLKGTLEDVEAVFDTYKPFELTAKALGLAARYRGLDFVKTLVEKGATFTYEDTPTIKRKYKTNQTTVSGTYKTEYYLMLVPEKLDFEINEWGESKYKYTPLCGIVHVNIPDEAEEGVLSAETRLEIVKYLDKNKACGISLDEMLFWALTRGELGFADLLMEYGADLDTTPPTYYKSQKSPNTYMTVITSSSSSFYRNNYMYRLSTLDEDRVKPVLERFVKLANKADKKLLLTQSMFDSMHWNDESLVFALENLDFDQINQKKALEFSVEHDFIASLEVMARAGWLSVPVKREGLIEFARANQKNTALVWLMDFKNRTVDLQAEAAKEDAKLLRELTENPNSVSALKKLWSYKKLEDGTLIITGYKGDAVDVEVPAVIGRSSVTVIGEEAFCAPDWNSRVKNTEARMKIRSIVIPEGVTKIQKNAFWNLTSLKALTLPNSIKRLEAPLARNCNKLKKINIPEGAKIDGNGHLFLRCSQLPTQDGFLIINNVLHDASSAHINNEGNLVIPENVTEISNCVFCNGKMSSVTLPRGLKAIGKNAFENCHSLKEVEIPEGVGAVQAEAFYRCAALKTVKFGKGITSIGSKAFEACRSLRDVYIPGSVKKLGKEIFGRYDNNTFSWRGISGIYVHTQKDSPVAEYMKHYSGCYVVFDYDE